MWKNKAIPGYTLVEIIIVMVLVGIISSFAYSAMGIFVKNMEFFRKISNRNYELTLLNRLLTKDFFASQKVESFEDKKLVFVYGVKQIVYTFNENYVIRQDQITDTFHLKIQNYEALRMDHTDHVIQKVTFDVNVQDQKIPFVLNKIYSAEVFVNESNVIR